MPLCYYSEDCCRPLCPSLAIGASFQNITKADSSPIHKPPKTRQHVFVDFSLGGFSLLSSFTLDYTTRYTIHEVTTSVLHHEVFLFLYVLYILFVIIFTESTAIACQSCQFSPHSSSHGNHGQSTLEFE